MSIQTITQGKAYDHKIMMKTAYIYLPVFALVILVCSFFEKLRFFLYLTVVGTTYGFILNQLKKKSKNINFKEDKLIIGQAVIMPTDIKSYYMSLPLNELLMLRIKTRTEDIAIYIDKNLKTTAEYFFDTHLIKSEKIGYDNYLKYGHLILPFVFLGICAVAFILFNHMKYGL